ncbi:hypothetical protein [Phascolarctobacterium faecium]|uniref:hypothetical protein n=1 Tax=Phascolarctobacterium faecium TaxID=33025 RepID=UPI0035204721
MNTKYKNQYLVLPSVDDTRKDTKEAVRFTDEEINDFISDGYFLLNRNEYSQLLGNTGKEYLIDHLTGALYEKPIVEYVPTAEEIQAQLTNAVQNYMDETVKTRNYDNIHTACTYSTSTDSIFAAEGVACVRWRDAVWRKCYELLSEVNAGTRTIPTAEELIAELPKLEW